jgi:hypothetical protein
MDDRILLLHDLDDGRRLTLLALADFDEEQGDARRAAGWRWLARWGRWPIFVVRVDDYADEVQDAREYVSAGWEWWREKGEVVYSCSLPSVLMDAVRRAAHTPKSRCCRFESPSQALLCAATCAGRLLAVDLLDGSAPNLWRT